MLDSAWDALLQHERIRMLAAFLEGEGCFRIGRVKNAAFTHGCSFYPQLAVEQTDMGVRPSMLDRIEQELGGKTRTKPPGKLESRMEQIHLGDRQAVWTARQCLPWLTQKAPAARLLICYGLANQQRPYFRSRLTKSHVLFQWVCYQVSGIMNQGGADKRQVPQKIAAFFESTAPHFDWLYPYLFEPTLDGLLYHDPGAVISLPSIEAACSRLGSGWWDVYSVLFYEGVEGMGGDRRRKAK